MSLTCLQRVAVEMSRVLPRQTRLDLDYLSRVDHPTMQTAQFSVFNDPAVRRGSSLVRHYTDMDGIVLSSRNLDSFKVGNLGVAVVYTDGKVIDGSSMLKKCDFFQATFPHHLQQFADNVPAFKLLDLPGAPLKVVATLNSRADGAQVETLLETPSRIRDFFLIKVLNKAILALPGNTRTASNNIAMTTEATGRVPDSFKIFREDVAALSSNIRSTMRALPYDTPYKYSFLYVNLGQKLVVDGFLTTIGTGLDMVVAEADKVESACIHLAANLYAMDDDTALFWDLTRAQSCMTGKSKQVFHLMGLTELGNIACQFPRAWGISQALQNCWSEPSSIVLTFAQMYTPSISPVGKYQPFLLHPFLLSFILGRQYVSTKPSMKALRESTEQELDYRILMEAVVRQLSNSHARFEVVVTSTSLTDLLDVDSTKLARTVKSAKLAVEVSVPVAHAMCRH